MSWCSKSSPPAQAGPASSTAALLSHPGPIEAPELLQTQECFPCMSGLGHPWGQAGWLGHVHGVCDLPFVALEMLGSKGIERNISCPSWEGEDLSH